MGRHYVNAVRQAQLSGAVFSRDLYKAGAALGIVMVLSVGVTRAADGTWNADSDGDWSDGTKWSGSTVADGPDSTATLGNFITGNRSINLDSSRSIGNITVSDTSHNYTITNANTLTLDRTSGIPTVNVTPGGRTLTLNSVIGGNDGLTKSGSGTLTLGGVNTFTGPIILNGGTLAGVTANTLGSSGNITFTAGTTMTTLHSAYPSFAKSVAVDPGVTATFSLATQYYRMTFTDPLTGSGTVYLASSANGQLTFPSAVNTFTGTIRVGTGGGNNVFTVNSLPDSANRIRLYGGTFRLGSGTASALVFTNRQFELAHTTAAIGIDNDNGTSANTITIHPDLLITGTGNKTLTLGGSNTGGNTFGGGITNGVGSVISLTKSDGGLWILSGTNTYTGTTRLEAGTLRIAGTDAMSTNSKILSRRNTTISIRTDDAGSVSLGNEVEISSIDTSSGVISKHTIDVRNNGGATTGTTIALGKADFATGDLRPNRQFNVTGSNGYILEFGDVDISPSIRGTATGGPNRFNPISASISITGTVKALDGDTAISTTDNNLYLGGVMNGNSVSGTIADPDDYPANTSAEPLNVYKGDIGTWTLSGTNTYTGVTTVNDGQLIVSGSIASTSVTVNGSGVLSGTGVISGEVNLVASGVINLLDDTVATLTISSNLNINGAAGASELYFDLGTAGNGMDKIVVTGDVTMTTSGAGVIVLNQLTGTRIDAGTYDLIDCTGTMTAASNFDLATTVSHGNTYTLQLDGTSKILQLVVAAAAPGPQPVYWKGSTDTDWTTAGNWYDDEDGATPASGVPGYNSDVYFYANGATRLTTGVLDSDFDVNSLNYTTGAVANTTIGGTRALILEASSGTGIVVNTPASGAPVHTINADVMLATDNEWAIESSGDLTVGGAISDFGSGYGITKTGAGLLTLSAASTFSGPVAIDEGTLEVFPVSQALSPLGISSSDPTNLVLASGTTLRISINNDSDDSTDRGFTIDGVANGDSATLEINSINNTGLKGIGFTSTASPGYGVANQTRTLILTGTRAPGGGNYNRDSANRIVANIADNGSGAVSLVKNGSGYWRIAGSCTYSGGTTINTGYLRVGKANAFPTDGLVTLADTAGAKLVFDNNDQALGALAGGGSTGGNVELGSGTLTIGGSGSASYAGTISGSGDLTKQGTGTQTLTGANTYSGVSTINAGTLEVGGAGTLSGGTYANTIANAGVFKHSSSANQTLSGVISGSGALLKDGSGELTLSATNTYSGDTTISNGVLKLGVTNSIGNSGAITLGAGGVLDVASLSTYAMPGASSYTFINSGLTSGSIAADELDVSSANVTISGTPSGGVTLATYTTLTGAAFATTNGVPAGWVIDYSLNGSTIVLLPPPDEPEVITNGAQSQTATSATLSGLLTTGSSANAWICWGTNDVGATDTGLWGNVVSIGEVLQAVSFSTTVSGLDTNRTYWFRTYVTNALGTDWSDTAQPFSGIPQVEDSTYSMQITFTNFAGRGTLTNFPALIRFTTTNINNYVGFLDTTNGWDLRFWTNSALTGTELNYEIEEFSTNSSSYVWVQIPELTNNLSIWASWGSSSYTDQEAYTTNGAVWESSYKAVWHLGEADNLAIDATANEHDASGTSGTPVSSAGMIGLATDFNDSTGDRIIVPADSGDFSVGASFTVSGWIYNRNTTLGEAGIVGTHATGWIFGFDNSGSYDDLKFYDGGWRDSSTTVAQDAWTYLAYTFENGVPTTSTDGRFHIDGYFVGAAGAQTRTASGNLHIGEGGPGWGGRNLEGVIDELRIESVTRSTNWIWACYMNQGDNHDSFVQYGAPGTVIANLAPSDFGNSKVVFNGSLSARNTNYTVYVHWGIADGGTNPLSWGSSDTVGSWTNVTSTNISYTNNGLSANRAYYYSFRASNDAENVWASPSWFLITPPLTGQSMGTIFRFR